MRRAIACVVLLVGVSSVTAGQIECGDVTDIDLKNGFITVRLEQSGLKTYPVSEELLNGAADGLPISPMRLSEIRIGDHVEVERTLDLNCEVVVMSLRLIRRPS